MFTVTLKSLINYIYVLTAKTNIKSYKVNKKALVIFITEKLVKYLNMQTLKILIECKLLLKAIFCLKYDIFLDFNFVK